MVNTKNKKAKKTQLDPLPERFASLEEAGEFWDSHDSADYDEHFRDVHCEVEINTVRSWFLWKATCTTK